MAHAIALTWGAVLYSGISRRARRPCQYEAYVPDRLADWKVSLPSDIAADVSDAERAVSNLNSSGPQIANLEAVARLLLRAKSVASSRIEGLEVGVRRLARAEAAKEAGDPLNDVTAEAVLGNVQAMELAVNELAGKPILRCVSAYAAVRTRTYCLDRCTNHRPQLPSRRPGSPSPDRGGGTQANQIGKKEPSL